MVEPTQNWLSPDARASRQSMPMGRLGDLLRRRLWYPGPKAEWGRAWL